MKTDCEMVFEKEVTCEGSNDALGHPKVYLKLTQKSGVELLSAECTYCGKKFFYKHNE